MVKFNNISEQEKLYDILINKSLKCKTIKEAQVLIDVFEKYEWNDTNYRMLDWVLRKNLGNQKVNQINRMETVNVTSKLFEGNNDFISLLD